jgi:Rne/Rng family ribonuclease
MTTRELYVSSTPHETRVGMVEDDLLAEIYLERENEYTLAGSIYKGRVTRVLPGMQSAFVDIGLERDAFLYVSDFMELPEEDDLEEIPADRAAPTQSYPTSAEAQPVIENAAPAVEVSSTEVAEQQPSDNRGRFSGGEHREGRGDSRRGRRGRGRRGERMPESRFARPAAEPVRNEPAEQSERPPRTERPERSDRPERNDRNDRAGRNERNDRTDRSDYGPPPGYQPMLLPGESISKYSRLNQAQPAAAQPRPEAPAQALPNPPLATAFPDDEPLFTAPPSETREAPRARSVAANAEVATPDWSREQLEPSPTNVASVFGRAETDVEESEDDGQLSVVPELRNQTPLSAAPAAVAGTVEEQEIEEEEAELSAYVDDLEDDAFEEMEEEIQRPNDFHDAVQHEIAASSAAGEENVAPGIAASGEATNGDALNATAHEEVEESEEDAEDAELEEAQAEAEALLAAESGAEPVEARADVRAPAETAALTRSAPRPGYDRRPGRGGRRGGGGRRFKRREPQNLPLISDLLKEGQEILVQIAKEPIAKKGARITSHIALPGRFLVYMPTVNHTGVSRKIASEEERQRLKRIIISERENGHGGFIVRTAAQGASEDELRADIRFLKGLWTEIKNRAESDKSPALIYHDLNVVERVLRDQVTSDFSAIWVDTEQEYERVLRFANRFQPGLVKRVKLYSKETPLFDQFGLNEEINKALKSKVWLKSGGYIVINQTEALVAIDVNTGKYVGKTARLEDTIVKTNVDAIKEIVRQIRLRDLGGIIIIDFIDMDERRNRQKVMQALEEALRADRAPSKVLQFNDFGLVAITRKRVKQSLERTIGSPCPYCQSTGYVKSVTTVCNDIYVEMRKMSAHLDHSDVMLRVNPEVAKALKANSARLLTEMEELTKKTVIIKSDPALHQEQFDIN